MHNSGWGLHVIVVTHLVCNNIVILSVLLHVTLIGQNRLLLFVCDLSSSNQAYVHEHAIFKWHQSEKSNIRGPTCASCHSMLSVSRIRKKTINSCSLSTSTISFCHCAHEPNHLVSSGKCWSSINCHLILYGTPILHPWCEYKFKIGPN